MNKKMIPLIVILVLLLGLGVFLVIRQNRGIAQNPEDLVGNTAGNLNNGGNFVEDDKTIYFANPYDQNTIYKMNRDLTDIRKISNAAAGFMNIGGDYLYYYQKNSSAASSLGFVVRMSGIYRSDSDGKHVLCLDKSDCDKLILVGNRVYYTKAVDGLMTLCLHSITTNKKDPRQLTDFLVNPAGADGSLIYYNGTESDHYLYAYDTRTDSSRQVASYEMWFPVYYGGCIYFLDLSANYRLCRLNLSTGDMNVLANERVDCFNVGNGFVYYQTNDPKSPALYKVRIDGTESELVSSGIYHNINFAGGYVFFQDFQADIPQYMCPIGSTSVSTFDDAKAAAMKYME